MHLQFLSSIPFLLKDLDFFIFYIQTVSPFSSVLSSLKALLCCAGCFPPGQRTLFPGVCAQSIHLQHAFYLIRRGSSIRISWVVRAGGEGEWRQQCKVLGRVDRVFASRFPSDDSGGHGAVRIAESHFLDVKQMRKCHEAFAFFTLFIRLLMVPARASCNKLPAFLFLQAGSITEDHISPRYLTREHSGSNNESREYQ